jgi:hypothetical protein
LRKKVDLGLDRNFAQNVRFYSFRSQTEVTRMVTDLSKIKNAIGRFPCQNVPPDGRSWRARSVTMTMLASSNAR